MSELIDVQARNRKYFKWSLLATASALALIGPGVMYEAQASDDADHPTVWIEIGGQLERQSTEPLFTPPFALVGADFYSEDASPLNAQKPPRFSTGFEGSISFQPKGSDWVISAGARYGRSNGGRHAHESGASIHRVGVHFTNSAGTPVTNPPLQYVDTLARHDESHSIVDFQVGREIGIGLFDSKKSSLLSLGVRFAQFSSKSSVTIGMDPDATYRYFTRHITGYPGLIVPLPYYHTYNASATAKRNFAGVGPSLSWKDSITLMGDSRDSEVALDFGLNGSLLFGRQKASVHHGTSVRYHSIKYVLSSGQKYKTLYNHQPPDQMRSRSVVVPNLGGFAGLSFRYDSAKVSFGYRGEMFFGAMDDGLDAARSANRSFHGPYATISIGLP